MVRSVSFCPIVAYTYVHNSIGFTVFVSVSLFLYIFLHYTYIYISLSQSLSSGLFVCFSSILMWKLHPQEWWSTILYSAGLFEYFEPVDDWLSAFISTVFSSFFPLLLWCRHTVYILQSVHTLKLDLGIRTPGTSHCTHKRLNRL